MADFRTEVFQNEFLSDGATDVHAIVTVTSSGAGHRGHAAAGGVAEIVIIDTSGSMSGPNIDAAKYAAQVAVDQIADGTWFAIIGGSHVASRAFPYPNAPVAIVQMEPGAREEAKRAISLMRPSGGTAMSTWLRLADAIFAEVPQATQRHAILLTDGRNESEPRAELSKAIRDVTGHFQCDARGVGSSWEVAELREIATALLGTVDLIREPRGHRGGLPRAGRDVDVQGRRRRRAARVGAAGRAGAVRPPGRADRRGPHGPPHRGERADRRVPDRRVGRRVPRLPRGHPGARRSRSAPSSSRRACRSRSAARSWRPALVKARWSDDSSLTARINPEVAHYTGQAELASVIQEGLAAKAAGDEATATVKLGRAVQLAAETGNEEATSRLRRVVDIDDEEQGTVRLKRNADKLDEMALDTASTKTTRVRR